MFMSRFSLSSRGPDGVALLALALIGLATLVAVGQPIITDDIWIHLTLGRAYLDQGPWLQRASGNNQRQLPERQQKPIATDH